MLGPISLGSGMSYITLLSNSSKNLEKQKVNDILSKGFSFVEWYILIQMNLSFFHLSNNYIYIYRLIFAEAEFTL